MTGVRGVGNSSGPIVPAAAEQASKGIGPLPSKASPSFESIAGRAPQASSSQQAPRLSLSSAQSKLGKLFNSQASPSSASLAGQPMVPAPGNQANASPPRGPQPLQNETTSRGLNKTDSAVPPDMRGGNIPQEVFRGDTRPPEIIFNQGFKPLAAGKVSLNSLKDHVIYNEPGPYISTSSSQDVASHFAKQGPPGSHVYSVDPTRNQAFDVNHLLGSETPFIWEKEILLAGGVAGSQVKWGEHPNTGVRTDNPRYGKPDAPSYPAVHSSGPSSPVQPTAPFVGNPFAPSPPSSPKWDSSPLPSPKWDASPPPSPKWDSSPPGSPGFINPFAALKETSK